VGEVLSASNKRQLWIPAGFAHGFMALSDGTEVLYKATDFYNKAAERAIVWNDADIDIAWPETVAPVLSDKDAIAPRFRDAETFA
jgi:dTDP-4-dehydrorhamnose 3,5-epimerase